MTKAPPLYLTSLIVASLVTGSAWAQPDDERPPDEGETFEPTDEAPPEEAPSEEAPAEEAPSEEAPPEEGELELTDEELGLVDPDAPPPKGMGVVSGKLTETKHGEPLIEAQVELIGKDQTVFTDFDGNYRLELPPGTYDLRFWYELHQPKLVKGVTVRAGETVKLDEALVPEEGAVETFEIETEADTSSVEGQLLSRKRASVVGDAIGRAEISRTPDSNAAAAARRVVGATVVGDRFVYVRGLGERYTNALLDGVPLPSPEPDRATVPLDLFPSKLLDSLVIVKTFTPDMPGDFAGGSVRIGTRRLPKEFTFTVSGSLGLNSQTTGSDYLQYRGSSTDWLGIDGGTRQLPGSIPSYRIGRGQRNPDGSFQTSEQLQQWGQDLNAYMSTKRDTAPPNHSFDVVIGNTFDLGGTQKLGVMGALGYGRSFQKIDDELFRTARSSLERPDDIVELNRLTIERGIDAVRWGGLLGLTWEINPRHRVHATGLYSRRSSDEAREIIGRIEEREGPVQETRLEFSARDLVSGQLRGEHDLPELDGARLEWQGFLSLARRNQPDTRATVHQYSSGTGWAFEDDSFSGLHFFADSEERTAGGGFDWTQPLGETAADDERSTKLKIGSLVSLKTRTFRARRFRFRPSLNVNQSDPALICERETWDTACLDDVFAADNIGPFLTIEENTRDTSQFLGDTYDASLDVYAGYAMVDTHLTDDLRLVTGPRLELSKQTVAAFVREDLDEPALTGEITGEDLLPAVSLVWAARDDLNLRAAGSRTLARPQLREIAPFSFTNYFGGFTEQGNPDLDNTHVWNGDLRVEWFPSNAEVVAASFFAKRFVDPIEPILTAASGNGLITYQNVAGATLIGGEIEARKSFDFVADPLEDLSLIANLTVAHSKVSIDLDTPGAANLRSTDRPLTNQAPWVINAALDYDNQDVGLQVRLLYNIIGRRLAFPSENPVPDVYQQPRHDLGATVSQRIVEGLRVKLTGRNLINDDYRYTYGTTDAEDKLHRRWREGLQAALSASYTY